MNQSNQIPLEIGKEAANKNRKIGWNLEEELKSQIHIHHPEFSQNQSPLVSRQKREGGLSGKVKLFCLGDTKQTEGCSEATY